MAPMIPDFEEDRILEAMEFLSPLPMRIDLGEISQATFGAENTLSVFNVDHHFSL